MRSEKNPENNTDVIAAILPFNDAYKLVWSAGNIALNNLEGQTAAPFAGEYFSRLFDHIDQLKAESIATEGKLPSGEVPKVYIGSLLYAVRTEMRNEYGDPHLAGPGFPVALAPKDIDAATHNEAATLAVRMAMNEAYNNYQA